MNQTHLTNLPDEILLLILEQCSLKSLASIAQTCRACHNLHLNETLWKKLYLKTFPFDPEYDYKFNFIDSKMKESSKDLSVFQRKSSGKKIGGLGIAVGVGAIIGGVILPAALPVFGVMSVGGLLGGAYMMMKGYYDDPDALEEYFELYEGQRLVDSMKGYWNFEDLVKVAGKGNVERGYMIIREKIEEEVPKNSLKALYDEYSDKIFVLVDHGVLVTDFLRYCFENDVTDTKYVYKRPVMRLVGILVDVLFRIGFDSAYMREIQLNCPISMSLNWPEMFSHNVYYLVEKQCIDMKFVREKCLETFFLTNKFSLFEKQYGLDFLLKGIVQPEDVTLIFIRDIIQARSLEDIFQHYYKKLILKFKSRLVTEEQLEKLSKLYIKYKRIQADHESKISEIEDDFYRRKAQLKNTVQDESDMTPEYNRKMADLSYQESNQIITEKKLLKMEIKNLNLKWELFISKTK